jgi:superfamily I DNA and RNA helicase
LIREQKCERLFSDNTSINRFVVSQAILKCVQLIWDFMARSKKAVLYGYNTDGIYIKLPKLKFENKKDVKFTENIGKAYKTDSKLAYFEKHYRDNLCIEDYEIVKGTGCIYNGKAGSGKTELLAEKVLKSKNPIVLSYTNKAIENIKKRLRKKGMDKQETNNICFTFDSYFCEWKGRNIDSLEDKTIFLEEYSMIPNKWITKIYEAFTLNNNKNISLR